MSTITSATPNASVDEQHSDYVRNFGAAGNWRQTLSNALIVTRREVNDSLRDWRIIVPIFILTLCFPALANVASLAFIDLFATYGADGEALIESFLPLMPMIVGFFPVSISLVIALETFVGEKERRSIEPLLSTPLTNTELYIGKVLSAMFPPLLAAYLGIGIYLAGLIFGAQQWRPAFGLILQILVLTTVQAGVMVTGAVVISSQTTSTRAANLLASVIIIPMSLLVIVESIIMVQPDRRFVLWWLVAALFVVIVLFVRIGVRIFNREELLGRSVDQLNLRWIFRVFFDQIRGITAEEREANINHGVPLEKNRNILHWYRRAVFPTFGKLNVSARIVGIAVVGAFIVGVYFSTLYTLPLDRQPPSGEVDVLAAWTSSIETPYGFYAEPLEVEGLPANNDTPAITEQFNIAVERVQPADVEIETPPWQFSDEELLDGLRDLQEVAQGDPGNVLVALGTNTRILMTASIMGLFSLGVLSTIIVATPFGVLGYIVGNIFISGVNPIPFLMSVATHGIVEVPAYIIAGAAILRAGAVVTRGPNERMTVGEIWLRAIADLVKVGVAVVFPLLVVAAILEVVATPYMVEWAIQIGF